MRPPPDHPDLFDAAAAREARDAGIALVDENAGEWKDEARARALKLQFPPDWEGLFEEVRVMLLDAGLSEPHSPNCWGSLSTWCVRRGLLEPTGRVENTRDRKSHACYTKVYRRGPA